MRVPDVVLLSVCFLFIKNHKTGNFQEKGTAFFVNLKSEAHSENRFVYLVTAKHVIAGIKESGASSVYIRLNKIPSGVDFAEIAINAWVFHKDQTVDACVLPGNPPHAEFEFADIDAVDMFATDERLKKDKVGIGDELQMIGLFSPLKGENRNHPIVRIGHLAAMPGPLISVEGGGKIRGYLADMRSIGGHSGAPVYVVRKKPALYRDKETEEIRIGESTIVYLLGVVSGHWDYELNNPESDIASRKDVERLNRGIAIITPIKHVLEILMYDELKEERKKDDEKVSMENAAPMDTAIDGSEEDVFTKDDFEESLKKVVKKPDEES